MERTDISDTLLKLRKHVYVFRNRGAWRDQLAKQCGVYGIKQRLIPLDMPVRWESTYEMVAIALQLREPVTAICASQQLDISMRDI